jgi:ribosomal protein L11 methyltransferase
MSYFQIDFDLKQIPIDILFAFLSDFEILGTEESPDFLIAYTDDHKVLMELKDAIERKAWQKHVKLKTLKPQNWNKTWEENFDPVFVDEFCQILAEFHTPKTGFQHSIQIQPKMAFGTGHHETTYMMIQMMAALDLKGASVFDFGCGTGILAILAEYLGAARILGLDNDPIAISNANENALLNKTLNTQWQCGLLEELKVEKFDFILANINRNVLLDVSSQIGNYLTENGQLILSGILEQDKQIIINNYEREGFKMNSCRQKGEWMCLHFTL